ncbi:unnamed protein product, partial [Phaeothamnion confervicola]
AVACLFSDVDGTLVHYYEGPDEDKAPKPDVALALPASKTGRRGFISKQTLHLAARIRAAGTKFVVVSGMRYSTFADRLSFLPYADAYVIENGGRIFYPPDESSSASAGGYSDSGGSGGSGGSGEEPLPPTGPLSSQLREDMDWRALLADACGPPQVDSLPPAKRSGPLWDLYRRLRSAGWEVDTAHYHTMIRINAAQRGSGGGQELERILADLPSELQRTSNFGLVDVLPAASGKRNVAAYLARRRFETRLEECAALGDDDNDIELALSAGQGAFLTGFTSASVAEAAARTPDHFRVATTAGVRAADEMLAAVLLACCGREKSPG